jgi:hypothetical protein
MFHHVYTSQFNYIVHTRIHISSIRMCGYENLRHHARFRIFLSIVGSHTSHKRQLQGWLLEYYSSPRKTIVKTCRCNSNDRKCCNQEQFFKSTLFHSFIILKVDIVQFTKK